MYYIVEICRDANGEYGVVKMKAADKFSAQLTVQMLNMHGGRYAYVSVKEVQLVG